MKVWLYIEHFFDMGYDYSYEIFETKDKAIEYMKQRNEELYKSFDVERVMTSNSGYADKWYEKTETSIDFYCYGGCETSYYLKVEEMEVK